MDPKSWGYVNAQEKEVIRVNGIEKGMSATEIGDTVTLIETKKNTYMRKRCGLQLIESEELDAKIINTHHQSRS